MFTYESQFCIDMNDGRAICKVLRSQGERYADCYARQYSRWGGGSVMVWEGISWRYKTSRVLAINRRGCGTHCSVVFFFFESTPT